MKLSNLSFFFFTALFMLSFVSAVPPVTEVGSFPEGFEIKYPNDRNIEQFKDYEFEFHVFNSSNGVPIIDTGQDPAISCYFHLYNKSGNHIAELFENTPDHIFDYSFHVDGANFTELGQQSYIIQCNSSTQGGFADVAFEVTTDGRTRKSILDNSMLLILLIIFVILFVLAYSTKIAWLGFVSSIPLMLAGIYTMIYGFNGFANLYTRGVAIIVLGFGLAIMIISVYDWFENSSEGEF